MGADDEKRVILGAPYVFARANLAKPSHVEVVTMILRGVRCHNDCGLYYVAASTEEMKPEDVCPDCNAPPKWWRIGAPEEWEIAVHLAFGNLVNIDFLRSRGVVSSRSLMLTPAESAVSRAIVRPPRR